MAQVREYLVTEPMLVANVFFVRAHTRAEAIQKVQDHEYDEVWMTDAHPVRPLRLDDARLDR